MWLIPPRLSLAYQAASGCSISPLSLCSPALTLRVSLSGKAVPRPLSWRGWQTRPWAQHLFGAGTWEGSMPAGFAAWFVSSVLGCPASLTAQPANAAAPETPAATAKTVPARSRKLSVLSKKVAPPWCSSRTSQPSFAAFELLTENSAIPSAISDRNYREWVTKSLTLSSSVRETLARVTNANASSCWPTIRANEGNAGQWVNQRDGSTLPTLNGVAIGWQTPGSDSFRSRGGERKDEMGLDQQARCWASPTASANSNRTTQRAPSHGETHGEVLAGQAADFMETLPLASARPTPAARDGKGENGVEHLENGTGRKHLDQLPNFVAHVFSRPVLSQTTGQPLSPTTRTLRRRLNPAFACWLMGWPTWWTNPAPINCAASAMVSWRYRLRSRLASYLTALEGGLPK